MFECGVCFDETSEEEVAIVEPCGHQFCRECVKSHAVSKIDEHRYPIPCPTCMTGAAQEDTGVINDALIQQLGISERQYAIFVEMQMAAFSLKVRCRKCENEFFVDKAEYEAADTVRCPLGCNFTWCKACSQAIDTEPGAAAHSCDGENELKHLMGEKGWKNCPGCSTPSEKISGCNHMTCPAPGCNVHFCYHCGEQIIRSTTQEDISNALGAHYARCALWIEGQDA
ncbi:hypothetical protein WOLCODRAFT_93291 [Wolfiporia cocos MD-104 SS10]|uniref:RING-type domain-containing protein n=1 Tax=Wolfiporia cocos (strain MD-104) TaxID=742152 RepID=A0A2H3JBJ7_WOLCO|nr:hypothetical protein WOLCODRAFT_93291 [Wolfiporia cocos MD-104 SS10]